MVRMKAKGVIEGRRLGKQELAKMFRGVWTGEAYIVPPNPVPIHWVLCPRCKTYKPFLGSRGVCIVCEFDLETQEEADNENGNDTFTG